MKSLKLFAAVAVLMIVSSAQAVSRDLLAQGSREVYWIARIDKDQNNEVETLVQSRHVGADSNWKQIAAISSRVISLATNDGKLAALMDNGDWMMLWDDGSSNGSIPEDGAKLLQLAGGNNSLWAIAAAKAGRPPTTRAATQSATSMPAGTLVLYRLDRGQWTMLASLPPSAMQAKELSLAILDGAPVVAELLDGGEVRTSAYNLSKKNWETTARINADPNTSRIKLLSDLEHSAMWIGAETGGGKIYFKDIPSPVALATPPDVSAADITVAGQNVRLLSVASGKIIEYTFGPDGSPRGKSPLPAPKASEEDKPFEWLSALAGAMLVLVLINSMRRRAAVAPEELEASGIVLAPIWSRFLAGTIDALPIIGTMVIVSMRVSPEDSTDIAKFVASMQIPFYISTGIYVLHTLICEWLFGWTIGKKLFGLRVKMIDGSAPTVRAIVVRNILRIVDVAMFFPLLLVFISPLRQRIGDVAGETIVVRN